MESFDIELRNGDKIKVNLERGFAKEISYSNCDGNTFGDTVYAWELRSLKMKTDLVHFVLNHGYWSDQVRRNLEQMIRETGARTEDQALQVQRPPRPHQLPHLMTDNIKLWVEALRSGEYKQAEDVLTKQAEEGEPAAHCCLGVACEEAIKHDVDIEVSWANGTKTYDRSVTMPPYSVIEWLGLPLGFESAAFLTELARMNDRGASFGEISDQIEKYANSNR